MQRRNHVLASIVSTLACALLSLALLPQAQAQEKKADPSGTWTWNMPGRDGSTGRPVTLKLKAEGEKVTGTLTTPGRQGGDPRQTEIENGKVTGDTVSFAVTREINGNKFTQKYSGKVTAETITGKIEFQNRNGETQSRDWNAKRSTDKAGATEKK